MKMMMTNGLFVLFFLVANADAGLVISQYVETNSGSTPKGIEVWNSMTTSIDFSATPLTVFQGTNGASLSNLSGAAISSGSLAAGSVLVIGSSDIGTYLTSQTSQGLGSVTFQSFGFAFNGDDALQIRLNGIAQDTIGVPGVDPGTNWSGGGVSTRNQNIAILPGITTGDADGWSDPSDRYETISTNPSGTGGLSGFGVAPAAVPEPSSILIMTLFSLAVAYCSCGAPADTPECDTF